jgi:hypothetical protein
MSETNKRRIALVLGATGEEPHTPLETAVKVSLRGLGCLQTDSE